MNRIPIECKGETADVLIYEQIGSSFFEEGLTAKAFAESLAAFGDKVKTINVRINSPGGSVFDGTAIYNTLRSHGAKVVTNIEGGALSIASLIAMAGDERRMAKNAYIMIHDPSSTARGKSSDMRRAADLLDMVKTTLVDTYANRTGHDAADINEMMAKETWLSASDAKDLGFVHSVSEETTAIAAFDPQSFANVPVELLNALRKEPPAMSEPKPATIAEIRAACAGASSEFILAQVEAGVMLSQAQSAWATEQAQRITELQAAAQKPGVAPLPVGAPPVQDEADFDAHVATNVAEGMAKPKAIAKAIKEYPAAYKAMLDKVNKR